MKQEVNPSVQLYMPEPERIIEAVSDIKKVRELIEEFNKLLTHNNIDEVIEKIDCYISIITNQLSDEPEVIQCYKNEQQKRSDEYFFIQRSHTEVEKRFILNAFIIARDVLENNKIDCYLGNDQIKLILDVMANFLSYSLLRGELNERR